MKFVASFLLALVATVYFLQPADVINSSQPKDVRPAAEIIFRNPEPPLKRPLEGPILEMLPAELVSVELLGQIHASVPMLLVNAYFLPFVRKVLRTISLRPIPAA